MESKEKFVKKSIDKHYDLCFAMNGFYHKWAKLHSLTDHSLFTLQVIDYYREECTQKFICEKLVLPKQTIASILEGFEKKGFIFKKINPKDKRNRLVSFTEEGELYAKPILNELEKIEIDMFGTLSREELRSLIEIDDKFLKFIDNYFK